MTKNILKTLSLSKSVIAVLLTVLFSGCFWEGTDDNVDSYLTMDDSEYPYAGLPRIVIETKDFKQIRDRETEIPAKFQIYDKDGPASDVFDLTVRGRGNSSFKMPKYGLKLEFAEKQNMFGMPANKDWILIANYGDKTHLRNHMIFRLSEWLGARYTPKTQFVELYLNRRYMGLYLFTESIKASKDRVNIPKHDYSFLFEKEDSKKIDDPYVETKKSHSFHVKYPKNPSKESLDLLTDHLDDFEKYLDQGRFHNQDNIDTWLDMNDYLTQYWLQEYSKNEDGRFARSIYMTWEDGDVIHFGPIWDLDLGFGNESQQENKNPEGWFIKKYLWNKSILNDSQNWAQAAEFWNENRSLFKELIDSIPIYVKQIEPAIKNEYKRWPIISNTENWALKDPYDSYDDAIKAMSSWMEKRFKWIEENL
ncbi:MAG: CotH kinase family protein [Fibrobacter sp.]|nr:CotH kinase family protein [Fibrobacter sp.]